MDNTNTTRTRQRGQKRGFKIHLEGKPVRIISASLSDKVLDALERHADREGISRSWAAGKLIEQALGMPMPQKQVK